MQPKMEYTYRSTLTFRPTFCDYSLLHTVVIFLCGPEANDGVGDRGGID